jgi:putative spermidine/putrescine transport system permease protein
VIFHRPAPVTSAAAIIVALFLIGPSLLAVPASFTDMDYLSLPRHALSLQHYERFLTDSEWIHAFELSLSTSLAAAAAATLLGTGFSVGFWGFAGRSSGILRAAVLLPLATPGIIAALALFLLWTKLGLYDTVLGVVLVQTIVGLPFVVVTTSVALNVLDPRQVCASRSLGAAGLRTLWRVVLPGIRRAVLTGFVLALVTGWDEAVITLFITGRDVQVLPRKIWDSLRYDVDPIVAVVATIMLVATVLGVILALLLSTRTADSSRVAGTERRDA